MDAALVSLLARAAFMHHDDPSGMYQSPRVGMMLECSTGELLARATIMHHADPSGVYQPRRLGMMHECSPGE